METTDLIIFNKNEIPEILSEFGIQTRKEKERIVLVGEEGQVKCCDSCGKEMEINRVGSIAHGSHMVFCDNPICLASWVAKNKI